MTKDYHRQVYDCTVSVLSTDGRTISAVKPEWKLPGSEHIAKDVDVSFLKRRPVYTNMLLDQCLRVNIPVHMGCKAEMVDESETGVVVTTADGETHHADVCVAADGLHSIAATQYGQIQDTGYATARVAFPRSCLEPGSAADGLLADADRDQPEFRVYLADDIHLILFLTKDWVAFALTHPSTGRDEESWHNFVEAEPLVQSLEQAGQGWDPAVMDFIRQNPYKVVDWKLLWRDSNPMWTSPGGRVIRVGDAAHAFLPSSGNGAVQALEDAISLGECLRLGGKSGIPWATRVHNRLRYERTSVLQQMGFVNRDELHANEGDELQRDSTGRVTTGFFQMGSWVWKHDPERYAWTNFSACESHLKHGTPFANSNLPAGHVFKSWTLASEAERVRRGEQSDLKKNGYWGL